MSYFYKLILVLLLVTAGLRLRAEEIRSSYAQICFNFEDNRLDTCLYTDEYTFKILKNFLEDSKIKESDTLSYIDENQSIISISKNYNLNNKTMDNFFGFILESMPEIGDIEITVDSEIIKFDDRNKKIKEVTLLSQVVRESLKEKIKLNSDRRVNGVNGFYTMKPITDARMEHNDVSNQEITDKYFRLPIYLKTNLLFDAVSVLNFEVEYPILNNLSIAGEWMFPWWLNEKKQNCLQILKGSVEAKYWFRKCDKKTELLNGWYAGVFYSGGIYDIEYKKKGYQGEAYYSAGVSIGYSKPLTKCLNMEFGISGGFINTDYIKYEAIMSNDSNWHLLRKGKGNYTYFGPTNLKVSLVWRPTFLMNKKGGHQ